MMCLVVIQFTMLLSCAGKEGPAGAAGEQGSQGSAGQDGDDGTSSLVRLSDVGPGAQCTGGGQRVDVGPDVNNNGTLDDDEVNQTAYVCNGVAGQTPGNAVVATKAEAAGANCATGGVRVDAGVDLNSNQALDPEEITSTTFVCNGQQGSTGTNGVDGLTTLLATATEPPGANCPVGGVGVRTGQDDNADGILQPAEVDSTSYICDTAPPVPQRCDQVTALVPGTVQGNTRGRQDHFSGCSLSFLNSSYVVGSGASDQVWSLRLEKRSRVALQASGFDIGLYLTSGADCATSFLVHDACVDREVQQPEYLERVLDPGQYWVVVDGYSDQTGATSGSYSLSLAIMDPCGEEEPMGRCDGPSVVSWCIVPPAGVATDATAYSTCLPHERCRTVQGVSTCLQDPAVPTCTPGAVFCANSGQLGQCQPNGTATLSNCPNGCEDRITGAACTVLTPTNTFTATMLYEYRPPTPELADWSAQGRSAPFQRATVQSFIWDGSSYILLDSAVTDDEGRFSVRVDARPRPEDVVAIYAAYTRPQVPDPVFAVAQPNVPDGLNAVASPGSGQVYYWTLSPFSNGSGRSWFISDQAGAGAIRVFDGMRVVFENSAQLYYRNITPKSLVVWLRFGSSWTCGECVWPVPTTAAGAFDTQMFINGNRSDAQYWADSVTFHEVGHWTMSSFGVSPGEGGPHFFGVPYYPGLGWSEGWATFVSADWRRDSRYVDKQNGTMFWIDVARRQHSSGAPWPPPQPQDGLLGRIYELEVTAMLYGLSQNPNITNNALYRALATPRAGAARRGYTRRTWDVDAQGNPINVVNTGIPAAVFPDFLDALVCTSMVPNIGPQVDAVTQPSTRYAYPSTNPICN